MKIPTRKLYPKSPAQQRYVDLLSRWSPPVIVAHGPAGSGKTLIATTMAVEAMKAGVVDKIVMTRPAVSAEEQHGFLPGSLNDKMAPWVRPVMDVLTDNFSSTQVKALITNGKIELSPLAYMRGRTFKNSYIICDEAQNCTPSQVLMILTRLGENSRVVLTGDLDQHDRGFEKNGLLDFIVKVQDTPEDLIRDHIGIVELTDGDVQRHPSIPSILSLYQMR